MTPPPDAARRAIRRGILYTVAAVFVFSISNALVKWLVQRYPVSEAVFFRSWFSLVPALWLVHRAGGISALRTRRPWAHGLRGLIHFVSTLAIFAAFALMPLADAIAITFAAPLFLNILAVPMLGEKVGWARGGAVAVGLAGVLLMVRPGEGVFEIGALFALTNALLGAIIGIQTRQMVTTETSAALVFHGMAVGAVLSCLLLPFGWVTPTWADLPWLIALGLLSGLGQFLWVQGCRDAPASVAAPFGYGHMVFAMIFGFAIWEDVPDIPLIVGSLVVSGAGLFILFYETRTRGR